MALCCVLWARASTDEQESGNQRDTLRAEARWRPSEPPRRQPIWPLNVSVEDATAARNSAVRRGSSVVGLAVPERSDLCPGTRMAGTDVSLSDIAYSRPFR